MTTTKHLLPATGATALELFNYPMKAMVARCGANAV